MDVLRKISEVRHLFLDSGFMVCVLPSWWAVPSHLPALDCSMLCERAAPAPNLSFCPGMPDC